MSGTQTLAGKSLAFIGLGAMGSAMAGHLAGAGLALRGYDVRAEARGALEAIGGKWCDSAAEAADGADFILLMVINAAQAEAVLFEHGALDRLAPQGICILGATCPPAAVELLGKRVTETGRGFVDAPVSGGVAGALAGGLTVMAAAPAATMAAARPVIEAYADKLFHVGESPGQGAAVKTVNQLLCGVHIAAAAEAMALGEKAGIDTAMLLEILGGSAASSWMLKDRGPRMLQETPPVRSAVDIFVKDLGIVMEAGRAAKMPLFLAAAAHQMFLAASAQGKGSDDDSQVIGAYRSLIQKPGD
jgi:putative dehydrogenase